MPSINDIRTKFSTDMFELSRHAVDQSLQREISMNELREAIATGEIIEDYPDDKYGPSCLIYGQTAAQRALHIQCSYPSRPIIKVITMYQPDPQQWIDLRERKR